MNVLYISYDGALDQLGYSQIIPYLIGLSRKGVRIVLLTFEKKYKLKNDIELTRLRNILNEEQIKWFYLPYCKSSFLFGTFLNIIQSFLVSYVIVKKNKVDIIHARSFIGAIPALWVSKFLRIRFIFDMRGFWPEERIEGNIWRRKEALYKLAKMYEKKFLINSDYIICLTEEAKKIIKDLPYLKEKKIYIDKIPTCADTIKFSVRLFDMEVQYIVVPYFFIILTYCFG